MTLIVAGGLAVAGMNYGVVPGRSRTLVQWHSDPPLDGEDGSANDQGLSPPGQVPWLLLGALAPVPDRVGAVLALKPFRDRAAGVPDLLNWSHLVASGIVLCKDGSLLAGWFYRGPDIASSTDDERNWLTGRVNAALSRLGSGWATWIEAVRLPSSSQLPATRAVALPRPGVTSGR